MNLKEPSRTKILAQWSSLIWTDAFTAPGVSDLPKKLVDSMIWVPQAEEEEHKLIPTSKKCSTLKWVVTWPISVQSEPSITDLLHSVPDHTSSCQSPPLTWWTHWEAIPKSITKSTPNKSWESTQEFINPSMKNGFLTNPDKHLMDSKDKESWLQCWERVKILLSTHGKMPWPLFLKEST